MHSQTQTIQSSDLAAGEFQRARIAHWDHVAKHAGYHGLGNGYHRRLEKIYRFHIPPGLRVLEIGCGHGDLLAILDPREGVGIDFSADMIASAKQRYPHLRFIQADAHELQIDETFDVIILSDLVNDLWDVQTVLAQLRKLCTPRTRVIINAFSHLWEWPLRIARRMKLATPNLPQNWLTVKDISNLLNLAGFETMRNWEEVLWPLRTPLIESFCNRFLVKLWPFRSGALTNFVIARLTPSPLAGEGRGEGYARQADNAASQNVQTRIDEEAPARDLTFTPHPNPLPQGERGQLPTVSVIVAARNEAGNIENIFRRVPQLGGGTELIFVEGHSSDDTYGTIEKTIAAQPEKNVKLFRQTGKGKGDAVRLGFEKATGDILMILDADLTVAPEDLPRFFEAIAQGKGEFINGVRLVYPMEKQSMRFLNLLGNKFFGAAFSWLLGQSVRDTLCGTKVMWREDYLRLAAGRSYFGDFDPFGDFDLLFGAAKMDLKIIDLPIRYRERVYGTTNIQRFKHGLLLLRMTAFAATRIKFV